MINELKLEGILLKVNEIIDKDKAVSPGLYVALAQLGETFMIFIPASTPGIELVKVDACIIAVGRLRNKMILKGDRQTSTVVVPSIDLVLRGSSPFSS